MLDLLTSTVRLTTKLASLQAFATASARVYPGTMRVAAAILAGLIMAVACGETSRDDDATTSAGTSGASGNRGGGSGSGNAGDTSNAGSDGGGTTSGGGTGGGGTAAAGTGPVSTGEPECVTDADCHVVETCCGCFPAPLSAEIAECDLTCEQSACAARGLQDLGAACVGNRCVFVLSCDGAMVTCDQAEPECPEGQVASVRGGCWGPCVDATDCVDITSCDDCPAGSGRICIQESAFLTTFRCVEITAACAAEPTCECVDACFVGGCVDDTDGIECVCLQC